MTPANRTAEELVNVVSPELLRITAQQDLPVLVAALRAARNQAGGTGSTRE